MARAQRGTGFFPDVVAAAHDLAEVSDAEPPKVLTAGDAQTIRAAVVIERPRQRVQVVRSAVRMAIR